VDGSEILHQLIDGRNPIIYRVLTILLVVQDFATIHIYLGLQQGIPAWWMLDTAPPKSPGYCHPAQDKNGRKVEKNQQNWIDIKFKTSQHTSSNTDIYSGHRI
jgi:hypothetical protein